LESVKNDEGSSSIHIIDEEEDLEFAQDKVVQTRMQANKFKTKEHNEKEKTKSNIPETTKQQQIVNKMKTPLQITTI
jgi:hypothetical protein